ncbi:MAG: radical SAM protein [Alphaproteobacteria bacterium]|nr:radical SAM protein [Alphaproteobacteria bacterium]
MTAEAALPSSKVQPGTIATFITPAPRGCNLSCPFCFIRQRGEDQATTDLKPKDYVHFIEHIAAAGPLAAVCIQGYEPLLPEAMAYTRAILATGRRLRASTCLVTNGVELANVVDELAALGVGKIAVSIDAADAEAHDRQRGRNGAWAAAIEGIGQAVSTLPVSTELTVTSILVPKRRHYLEGMPALLKDLGVKCWVVNALRKIEPGSSGRPWGDRATILGDMALLQRIADRHGVDFTVDDEFDTLRYGDPREDISEVEALRVRRLERPSGVYRLLPNGQCSIGREILAQVRADTPRWNPRAMDAGAFIQSLQQRRPEDQSAIET